MNKIQSENIKVTGKCRIIKSDSATGKTISVTPFYGNLVMNGTDTGLNLLADRLNGTNTYSLNITHCDIGTGTNTPAISDTTLQTAVARTTKATGSVTGASITLRFFFADGDLANGSYYETGLFIDGTATVSTGKIFDRLLFGSVYTKGTGEDTTLEFIINFN